MLNILPVGGVGSILIGVKGGHRGTLVVGIVQALAVDGLGGGRRLGRFDYLEDLLKRMD